MSVCLACVFGMNPPAVHICIIRIVARIWGQAERSHVCRIRQPGNIPSVPKFPE